MKQNQIKIAFNEETQKQKKSRNIGMYQRKMEGAGDRNDNKTLSGIVKYSMSKVSILQIE